jgi:hypothetical protein
MLVTSGDNETASSMVLLLGKERRPFGGMLLRKGCRSNVAWKDWRFQQQAGWGNCVRVCVRVCVHPLASQVQQSTPLDGNDRRIVRHADGCTSKGLVHAPPRCCRNQAVRKVGCTKGVRSVSERTSETESRGEGRTR